MTDFLKCVLARLRDYSNIVNKQKKIDGRNNVEWLLGGWDGLLTMNLRILAVFNHCLVDKPYVLLMDLLSTMLLQTLPDFAGGGP